MRTVKCTGGAIRMNAATKSIRAKRYTPAQSMKMDVDTNMELEGGESNLEKLRNSLRSLDLSTKVSSNIPRQSRKGKGTKYISF